MAAASHPLVVALLAAALLWPAAINGLPLVFPDTLDYLTNARDFRLGITRPPGYAWTLLPPWHLGGIWAVAVAQAILTSWLLLLGLRVSGVQLGQRQLAAVLALVVVATPAPMLVSWIMADALSAPTLLAGAVLAAAWRSVTARQRAVLVALILVGAAAHQTHVPMLLAAAAAVGLTTGRLRGSLVVVATAVTGAVAVMAANLIVFGAADTAQASPVFLLARLAADGLVAPYLPALCAEHPAMLFCTHQDWLAGRPVDDLLWQSGSPIWAGYHGLEHARADAQTILAAVVPAEWPTILANGLRRALALPGALRFPEADLRPMAEPMLREIKRQMPELLALVSASAQLSGGLAVLGPVRAMPIVTGAALLVLPLALIVPGPIRGMAAAVLAGIAANALVVGMSAEPYDRYNARLAWLAVPLAAAGAAQLLSAWRCHRLRVTASSRPTTAG
jgi:hypothetical protein